MDLVEDLVDFHAHTVDPKELSVSTAFFQQIASEQTLAKYPYIRVYLVVSQYCEAQANGPALSQFLESGKIANLCKKGDMLATLENKMREIKAKYLPILQKKLGSRVAKLELAVPACAWKFLG